MASDLSTFDEALKDDYSVGLRNSINNSNVILTDCVKRNPHPFVGRKAKWAVRHGRSAATAFRAEGGTLPTAGNQEIEDPEQTTKYIYHPIKLSGQVISASKSDAGAFDSAMDVEMQGAQDDLTNQVCRALFGKATVQTSTETVYRTGVLARINGAPSANVITVNAANGSSDATEAEMLYFFVGQLLDSITTTSGAVSEAAMVVTAVDIDARTITVDDDGSAADNDTLVISGSYNTEFPGLGVLINDLAGDKIDSTNAVLVHGLSAASVPTWQSAKVGGSTSPISEKLINQAFDRIITRGNGKDLSSRGMLITSYDQMNALADTLQTQKRYEGREVTLTSGWRGLKLARGQIFADRYCQGNDGYLIDPEELAWFVMEDFGWDEIDGRIHLRSTTTDAVEARMKAYVSPAALVRNAHCRLAFQAV